MSSEQNQAFVEITASFLTELSHSQTSDWCVCRFRHNSNDITVVGMNIPQLPYPVTFSGKWVVHPVYGEQFKVECVVNQLPEQKEDVFNFIRSCNFTRGATRRILDSVKEDESFWDVLYEEPERFCELPGVSEKKITALVDTVKKLAVERDLHRFFGGEVSMTSTQYSLLRQMFADNLSGMLDEIRSNPFILVKAGFPFLELDSFCCKHAIMAGNDYRRLSGASYQVLTEALTECHTCLPGKLFLFRLMQLLQVYGSISEADCRAFVLRAVRNSELKLYQQMVYLPKAFEEEATIAQILSAMAELPPAAIDKAEFDKQMKVYARKKGFALSPNQEEAVWTVLTQPFCVITGGPGTGKSTILDAILHCWSHFYKAGDWLLMAPTGKAAVRMTETTDQPATTIHSTLKLGTAKVDSVKAADDEQIQIREGLVIIDESSMVDQTVASALISALANAQSGKQHFVLVGDPDQLPSVGYGNLLDDLIHSGSVPVCSLSTIYRQAADNPIVSNSIRIRNGVTELDWKNLLFRRYHVGSDQDNMDVAIRLFQSWVAQQGIEKVAVLAPYHKKKTKNGSTQFCSTEYLNAKLQDVINPLRGQRTITGKGVAFREGDRVMQLRNTDTLNNGDIGVITGIDPTASGTDPCLSVRFENGILRDYIKDELGQLDLAYAMSVHKSQGSRATRSLVKS